MPFPGIVSSLVNLGQSGGITTGNSPYGFFTLYEYLTAVFWRRGERYLVSERQEIYRAVVYRSSVYTENGRPAYQVTQVLKLEGGVRGRRKVKGEDSEGSEVKRGRLGILPMYGVISFVTMSV